jgi:hypothetical protein
VQIAIITRRSRVRAARERALHCLTRRPAEVAGTFCESSGGTIREPAPARSTQEIVSPTRIPAASFLPSASSPRSRWAGIAGSNIYPLRASARVFPRDPGGARVRLVRGRRGAARLERVGHKRRRRWTQVKSNVAWWRLSEPQLALHSGCKVSRIDCLNGGSIIFDSEERDANP